MKHLIKLDFEECNIIKEVAKKNKMELEIQEDNNSFLLEIVDQKAGQLSELIKDAYTYNGFDINYNLTKQGKVYERIIDKFLEIGW